MDLTLFVKEPAKKARALVKRVTHSGETDLNRAELSELKQLCKTQGDKLLVIVYKECMKCLAKDHSQVRVATVKLLDYLFQKSHIFREKLLDDLNLFLELTLAITQKPKVKLKLPPPKKYSLLLQETTAKLIHKWHADFGSGYEKLRYAHRHLSEHRLVDFARFQVNTQEQLIRQQQLAERQERILTRSVENRLEELRHLKPDIEQLLAQIESLIDILVPDQNNIFNNELSASQVDSTDELPSTFTDNVDFDTDHRQHGFVNLSQSVDIEFSPYVEVERNPYNKEIVQTLKELKKELIDSKLTKLIAIEKVLAKRSEQLVGTLKEIIDIKTRSTNVVLKLGELKIVNEYVEGDAKRSSTLDKAESGTDDSDDDFQEVAPKEDLESYIPKSMRYEYGLEPIDPRELNSVAKTQLTEKIFSAEPSTSNSIVMSCNVRLDSGKLCPRRDKVKCPFHGKIIARDHNGVPVNDEDRLREERQERKKKSSVPDWQDPELLADIKLATGIDLTMPPKGRKTSPSKKNLVDARTCDLTPKQRLEKRLKMLVR